MKKSRLFVTVLILSALTIVNTISVSVDFNSDGISLDKLAKAQNCSEVGECGEQEENCRLFTTCYYVEPNMGQEGYQQCDEFLEDCPE